MNSFNKHLYPNALLIYVNKEKIGKDLVFMELVFQQRQSQSSQASVLQMSPDVTQSRT